MSEDMEHEGVGMRLDLSNVITFPKLAELRDSGGPVVRERRKPGECYHGMYGVTVCETDRSAKCNRCGAKVDAFDALLSIATHWDWSHTREAKKSALEEAKKIRADIDKLKAARTNARRATWIPLTTVTKALMNLSEFLKQQAARHRSSGDKSAAEALLGFDMWIRNAKTELMRAGSVEGEE